MMKFFAEGLPRLGVVNLHITSDVHLIDVCFSTVSDCAEISLPPTDINIPLPLPASKTQLLEPEVTGSILSLRIPAALSSTIQISSRPPLSSAEDVPANAIVSCTNCSAALGRPMSRWRDLPSDSWQEYSDYWHCHHRHSEPHTSSTAILPRPGTGLIGLTYLLLHHSDLLVQIKVPTPPCFPWRTGLQESVSFVPVNDTPIQKS
jgi:HECT-like Ubiquitin-conjugating enzyme (E2)-binding